MRPSICCRWCPGAHAPHWRGTRWSVSGWFRPSCCMWIDLAIDHVFLSAFQLLGHLLFNMLTLWMFGSQEEQDWGSRKFWNFIFSAWSAAGLVTRGGQLTRVLPGALTGRFHHWRFGRNLRLAGRIWHAIWRSRDHFSSRCRFSIKAKYLVGGLFSSTLVCDLPAFQGGVANFAHLGGLLFGFLYIKFVAPAGTDVLERRNDISACAMNITAGDGGARRGSLKSTCANMTATFTSTSMVTTFLRMMIRARGMGGRSQAG